MSNESARYATAKIKTYIAVLVQRSVDATLSELARTEGTSADRLSLDDATGYDGATPASAGTQALSH